MNRVREYKEYVDSQRLAGLVASDYDTWLEHQLDLEEEEN